MSATEPTKGYNIHSQRLINDAILPIITALKSTLIIMNKHLKEEYKNETTQDKKTR